MVLLPLHFVIIRVTHSVSATFAMILLPDWSSGQRKFFTDNSASRFSLHIIEMIDVYLESKGLNKCI